ncbi:hypothetical protein MRQ36_26845 [Micromonospora sp. R77]|uniref:hypothetical protein n=1 Tax=Micromonospora sp. R77 TaxID=2925836 RepID=UPI001F6085A7|nr:hypothetical protein [Micromonospora sp. R77]MCI4065972.1 hypothetical protein [Micromonospora sp. R77]
MATRIGADRRSALSTAALTAAGTRTDQGGPRRRRHPLRSTPVLIVVHGALLAALLLATAVVAAGSADPARTLGRRSADLAAGTSTSARQIYRTLADADAAASAVFLLSPGDRRRRGLIDGYDDRIRQVRAALSASMGAAVDDPDRLARLATIAARLQVYQRIIDDGLGRRCDDRTGPEGPAICAKVDDETVATAKNRGVLASAYAREASHYMSAELLRTAQDLWNYDTRQLREARATGEWWLLASLLVPLAALAALVAVQWWLWRRTRRRLNAGLLVATVGVAVVLGMLVASWWHWPAADDRFPALERAIETQSGTQQRLGDLLRGRADVYLALGSSVDPAGHRQDFLGRGVCGVPPEAVDCGTLDPVWSARQGYPPGAFGVAVDTVLKDGSGRTGAAARSFDQVTDRLTGELNDGDRAVDAAVARLPRAPRQLGGSAAWVTLLAGVAMLLGLRRRLVDYR